MIKHLQLLGLFLFLFWGNTAYSQDKNVDYFIHSALQNSPLLKDYRNQQLINKADSMRLKGTFGPQLYAGMNALYAPVYKGWGYDEALTNHHFLNTVAGISVPITEVRNQKSQYKNLTIQNSILENQLSISKKDLIKEVTSQYINVYSDIRQYGYNKEVYGLLEKGEKILKILTEKSVYKQTDYLTYQVSLEQQKNLLQQLRSQQKIDQNALCVLCGLKDTSEIPVLAPEIELTSSINPATTPFLKKFGIDSLHLNNEKTAIDFTYHPKMSIAADAGYYSSFTQQPYKNFGPSVTFSFSVPLYDGHQRKYQQQIIQLEQNTLHEYKTFYANQYSQQIASLLQQLQLTETLINQTSRQIKMAETLIQSNQKLLSAGDIRITDYLVTLQNYLNAKNTQSQYLIERLQIINQINYFGSTK